MHRKFQPVLPGANGVPLLLIFRPPYLTMNRIQILSLSSLLLLAFAPGVKAETEIYTIDPVHSGITFKIRHFFSQVPGNFSNFEGEVHFNRESPSKSKAIAKIMVPSVDTNNADRDEHLQQDDYFHSAEHPMIQFESTEWKPTGENQFEVTGNLSMLGQTHPVTMTVEYLGSGEGRNGVFLAGWTGTGTLDRTQWGLTAGRPAVGSEVDFEINIEARRQ